MGLCGNVPFSLEGTLLVSGLCEWNDQWQVVASEIRLWEASSGKEVKTLYGSTDDFYALQFSPDGKTLATLGWEHQMVVLWGLERGGRLEWIGGF
jgi:WD40 repeat protein